MALLCATLLSTYKLVQQPGRLFENFAETAMSISSLLSLVTCKKLDSLIGHEDNMLGRYAVRRQFVASWDRQGTVLLVLVNIVWLCKAIAIIVCMYASEDTFSCHALFAVLAGLLQSGSYLAFIHCDFHAMVFLQIMVDRWTGRFNKSLNCTDGARSWNTVQALMRHVAQGVESSFLAVQTSALIILLCCAGRVLDIIMTKSGEAMRLSCMLAFLEVPTLVMAFCALILFGKATAITEKSVQIPNVVNSLLVKPCMPISVDDQAFVSFIQNSCAGVYIKGSRLNATVLMNYSYLCGAVICGLFTTALSMHQ